MDHSTLAGWVGKPAALLKPLAEAIRRFVLSGQAIFADDTPVKLLAPGNGETTTARFWAYERDGRPWGSDAPPAAWYQFTPDCKGIRPSQHLRIIKVGCMQMAMQPTPSIMVWPSRRCFQLVRNKFMLLRLANMVPAISKSWSIRFVFRIKDFRFNNFPMVL